MKIRKHLTLAIALLGMISVKAQQTTSMSLKDAVSMALQQSNESKLATARVSTRGFETQVVKDNQYPDLKFSGQYLRLTNANVNLRSTQEADPADPGTTTSSTPKVNQLVYGQANLSMPIFSGFKLKNSIIASENMYKAEQANAEQTKENVAMQVIEYYAALYKAQKAVELLKESLNSSKQRVTDFTAMEQNGIVARNDLLKVQLQQSNVQLSLDEAEKNVRLINYQLVTLLKMSPDTLIVVDPSNIESDLFSKSVSPEAEALGKRKDLEALLLEAKASEANIKVAKSGYYPALSFVAGYVALDLQNVARVTNAVNVGVGFSYNLSSIFKTAREVKVAKSRVEEVHQQQAILTDNIKVQIRKAQEEYDLSIKQGNVYTEAVGQASENFRITKDKYDNGLSDTTELLDADVSELSAKINLAYAQANRALKFYELLEATGALTESFNTTKP